MLKIYDKLEDVPEALRGEYKLVGGKYVPDLSDDHPVLANNAKLLNEKQAAETKAATLESTNSSLKADLESAKAHSLPRGHRAVPVADVEAMDKLKEHGSATEIVAKLTEHSTLKQEAETRAKQDNLRAVAKELGYSNVEAFVRLPNLPDFEIRDANGKKSVVAKVKDAAGTVTEKPAQEFLEGSEDFKPFLSALKAETSGIPVPGQMPDPGKPASDIYSQIREQAKKREEDATKEKAIPLGQRRGITEIGGAVAA